MCENNRKFSFECEYFWLQALMCGKFDSGLLRIVDPKRKFCDFKKGKQFHVSMYCLTWTGSGRGVCGAPPLPWSGRPPGCPLRQVINDTNHFTFFYKIIDQRLFVLLMSFMLRPWLEADIWQHTADHLTVPVQLVFDRGTEIIIFLRTIYYLHLICFSFSNPLLRGFDKYWYWKLLLLLFELGHPWTYTG